MSETLKEAPFLSHPVYPKMDPELQDRVSAVHDLLVKILPFLDEDSVQEQDRKTLFTNMDQLLGRLVVDRAFRNGLDELLSSYEHFHEGEGQDEVKYGVVLNYTRDFLEGIFDLGDAKYQLRTALVYSSSFRRFLQDELQIDLKKANGEEASDKISEIEETQEGDLNETPRLEAFEVLLNQLPEGKEKVTQIQQLRFLYLLKTTMRDLDIVRDPIGYASRAKDALFKQENEAWKKGFDGFKRSPLQEGFFQSHPEFSFLREEARAAATYAQALYTAFMRPEVQSVIKNLVSRYNKKKKQHEPEFTLLKYRVPKIYKGDFPTLMKYLLAQGDQKKQDRFYEMFLSEEAPLYNPSKITIVAGVTVQKLKDVLKET